jgi:phosphoribosylanthranilate isomerase
MVKIKICGNTTWEDTIAAVEAGADAVGFVFYKDSPRAISPKTAAAIIARLPPLAVPVGVFVDEEVEVVRRIMDECGLRLAQLHGNESPAYCLGLGRPVVKAIRVKERKDLDRMDDYQVTSFLLDTFVRNVPGGTGLSFDWSLLEAAKPRGPIILAGGLTAENVAEAVRRLHPYGVDVSSGVEASPGKKDHVKLRSFIAAARAADSGLSS